LSIGKTASSARTNDVFGRVYFYLPDAKYLFVQRDGFTPDRWTYNTMIRTYGNADYPDKAVQTFKMMQDAGIMPDRVTYIMLVAAFEKAGNLLEAARWSLWMSQAGYTK
jgi:pentatricopeptide repeat protein